MSPSIVFKNPPLIELVCGIQYDIENFNFIIENDFYFKIKDRFPNIEINPPLSPAFDKISDVLIGSPPGGYERRPFPFFKRYFFIDKTKSKLIQLQEGRYLFNWRKLEEGETIYPRFNKVYEEFYHNWRILENVFNSNDMSYEVNQLELTYIDHISLEEFNVEKGRIDNVFTFFNNIGKLKDIDVFDINFAIPLKELRGHLNVKLNSATRKQDQKDIILVNTTVRGMTGEETKSIEEWFFKAHDHVITIFVELITEQAKQKWGLTNA